MGQTRNGFLFICPGGEEEWRFGGIRNEEMSRKIKNHEDKSHLRREMKFCIKLAASEANILLRDIHTRYNVKLRLWPLIDPNLSCGS